MSRRSIWPTVLLSGLIVLVVAVGFWSRWGARLRSRYAATLGALRDSGRPVEWDDIERQPLEPRENAYPLLKAAAALAECIDDELSELDIDDPDRPWLRGFDEDEPWTEGEAALVDEAIRRFGPGYRMIDEALGKPALCLPRGRTIEDGVDGILDFCCLSGFIEHEAYRRPECAPRAAERLLELVLRWRPRTDLELRVRTGWTERALGILRHWLEQGTLGPLDLTRWRGLLSDDVALVGINEAIAAERVGWIWLQERYLEGEDPLAETREAMKELRWILAIGVSEEERKLPRPRPTVPSPPWDARWYGRGFFFRRALERLAEFERGIESAGSEATMRARLLAVVEGDRRAAGATLGIQVRALGHVTVRRLARVALAIHEHARRHATPLAKLEDYAPLFGEPMPVDAVTGRSFEFERIDGTVTLSSPVPEKLHPKLTAALQELSPEGRRRFLRDELLVWEIRYGE
jgi:hypothetical protein